MYISAIPINIRRDSVHILYEIENSSLHDRTKSLSDITVCHRCKRIKETGESHSNCSMACRHCLGPFDPTIEVKYPPDSSSIVSVCSKRGCINRGKPDLACPRCPSTSLHDAEDCPLLSFSKRHVRVLPPSTSITNRSSWAASVGSAYRPPPSRPTRLTSPNSTSRTPNDITISQSLHNSTIAAVKEIVNEVVKPLIALITELQASVAALQSQLGASRPINNNTHAPATLNQLLNSIPTSTVNPKSASNTTSNVNTIASPKLQVHPSRAANIVHPPTTSSPESVPRPSDKRKRLTSPPTTLPIPTSLSTDNKHAPPPPSSTKVSNQRNSKVTTVHSSPTRNMDDNDDE